MAPVLPRRRVIQMARTYQDKVAHAEAIAERLANRDRTKDQWRSSEPLHRIADAFREQVAAERQVNLAIIAAREAGFSWTAIGMALGVSKQTAMQRFAKLVEAGV
jgi:hypothetical protein